MMIRILRASLLLTIALAALSACGGNTPEWENSANLWVNVNGDRVRLDTSIVADVDSFLGVEDRVLSIGEAMRFLEAGLPTVVGTDLGASVWVWSGNQDRQSRYNWPEVDRLHVRVSGSEVIPFDGWYVVGFSYRNDSILYPYLYSTLYNYIETHWGVVGTTTIYEIYGQLGEPTRESTRTTRAGAEITRWTYGGGQNWYRVYFEFNELGVKTGVGLNSFDFSDYVN